MNTKRNNIATFALVLTGSVMTMIACQKTGYPDPQPFTGTVPTAQVLVVNASPDAPSTLSIQPDNAPTSALGFGQASAYLPIPVGPTAIRLKGAGGTLGTNDLVQKNTTASAYYTAGRSYTLFVTDTINRPKAGTDVGGLRLLQVTDTLTAPAAGSAKLRFFHLAPDAPAVSVRLIDATGGSAAVISNRAYRAATGAALAYTTVPAGTYTAQVYAGATVPSSLTATPVFSAPITLASTKIYTAYARGLIRKNTLGAGVIQHN